MDEWVDEQMDKWMEVWIDRQMDRQMKGWIQVHKRCTHEWKDGQMNKNMNRQADRWRDDEMDRCKIEWCRFSYISNARSVFKNKNCENLKEQAQRELLT